MATMLELLITGINPVAATTRMTVPMPATLGVVAEYWLEHPAEIRSSLKVVFGDIPRAEKMNKTLAGMPLDTQLEFIAQIVHLWSMTEYFWARDELALALGDIPVIGGELLAVWEHGKRKIVVVQYAKGIDNRPDFREPLFAVAGPRAALKRCWDRLLACLPADITNHH